MGDLDGDGFKEIVFRTFDNNLGGRLYVINNGNVNIIASDGMYVERPIVLDDLDGDGSLEIIEVARIESINDEPVLHGGGKIFVRNRFGQPLPGWPQQPIVPPGYYNVLSSDIATGDLDRDGVKEIVVQLRVSNTSNNIGPTLFVFNFDGTIKWSYQFPGYYQWVFSSNDMLGLNDVVLGDVDGNDGRLLEVVYFRNSKGMPAPYDNFAYVFDHEGNIQSQWTVPTTEASFLNGQ